jgi:Terpene cyclase DEP1
VDLFLFGLSVAILIVAEARKHGIKFVWAYLAGSVVTAISVTFPLFLIARELRTAKTDPTRPRAGDIFVLALLGSLTAAIVIWMDVA